MILNEVKAKILLNVGYMVKNLEQQNLINEVCNGDLTEYMLDTIDDFLLYDSQMIEEGKDDFYQNMDNYYKNMLLKWFGNSK